jgi:hypothetical protein
VKPRFTLGHLVATPGALAVIEKSGQQSGDFLARHVSADWGEVPPEDIKENEFSLQHGFRLLSAFHTSTGDKLWVITEADRSSTRILGTTKFMTALAKYAADTSSLWFSLLA